MSPARALRLRVLNAGICDGMLQNAPRCQATAALPSARQWGSATARAGPRRVAVKNKNGH